MKIEKLNKKIKKGLLKSLSEYKVSVKAFKDPLVEMALNVDLGFRNGATQNLLLINLLKLLNEKLIFIEDGLGNKLKNISISEMDDRFVFGLTSQGGNKWEELFSVNWKCFWNFYFRQIEELNGVYEVTFYTTNVDYSNIVLNYLGSIDLVIKELNFNNSEIVYWKKVDLFYQIQFKSSLNKFNLFENYINSLRWQNYVKDK